MIDDLGGRFWDRLPKPARPPQSVKIIPDNDICGAHGACPMVDEELFNLDDDGFIAIGDGIEVPAGKEEIAHRGVDSCPLRALRIQ